MTPAMLRQFWSLVEDTQAEMPIALDDGSLVQWLLRRFRSQRSLDGEETAILNDYLHTKLPLIRDMVHDYQGTPGVYA